MKALHQLAKIRTNYKLIPIKNILNENFGEFAFISARNYSSIENCMYFQSTVAPLSFVKELLLCRSYIEILIKIHKMSQENLEMNTM